MLTLIENVTLPMDLCGLYYPRKSKERALELLEMVELEEHAYKLPSYISGGQQQRVAIARALANDPPVLVAMNRPAAWIRSHRIIFLNSSSGWLTIRARPSLW